MPLTKQMSARVLASLTAAFVMTACASANTSPIAHELTGAEFLFDLRVFEPDHPPEGIAETRTHALARHPDGDLLVTGHTTGGLDLDLDAPLPPGPFIAKLDPTGRAVWAHALSGDRALVATSPDGRVFVAVTRGQAAEPEGASRRDTLELAAFSAGGRPLWSHAPKNPGGVFLVERLAHHGGQLVVMGGLLNTSNGEPWEVLTSTQDAGVVTWWDDTNGALERSYTFGGLGVSTAADALPLDGGDTLLVGSGEGHVELSDGELLEHEGRFGFAARLTPDGEVAWARAWPARGYESYSEARRIIQTPGGVAIVGVFGGEIELYSGLGAEDAFGRVFVEELTLSGKHLNQYVIDGYNDQTSLSSAERLEDGAIVLGLELRGGYSNGPPTIELTSGPISPARGSTMSALVRLDLRRGKLGLLERWDTRPDSDRHTVIELHAMISGEEGVYVAGTLDGASKLGERPYETKQYTNDPCEGAIPGTLRHVIGGPYICRPFFDSGTIGFIQRVAPE